MKNIILTSLCFLGFFNPRVNAQTISPSTNNILYVNTNVSGGNQSGDSWANAVPELADVLKYARVNFDADTTWLDNDSLQIYVAVGIYKPLYLTADSNYTINGYRNNSFVMVKNVQLYGGFDPENGINDLTDARLIPAWDETDVGLGTVLSGDLGIPDNKTDNAYQVVISVGEVGTACLDGFTISGGSGTGSSIIINGMEVYNYGGGGVCNFYSSPLLTNLRIANNSASDGGGIFNYYSSSEITNVILTNNDGGHGGAIYNSYSSPVLTYVSIIDNYVSEYGSGGGGVFNTQSAPVFIHVNIIDNGGYEGGGIYNESSTLTMTDVNIIDNSAYLGGGIFNGYSSIVLTNASITDNYSNTNGGGIYNSYSSSVVLTNASITNNQAAMHGGGIFNEYNASTVLTNATISKNSATYYGGGIFNSNESSLEANNSIIWGNESDWGYEIFNSGSTSTNLDYCLYGTAYRNIHMTSASTFAANHSITIAPLFTDPTNGDFTLQPGSPAVNAASNALYTNAGGNLQNDLDVAGTPRMQGGIIDIGAYESANASSQTATMSGNVDWNRDCGNRQFTALFYEPSTDTLLTSFTAELNLDGDFTISDMEVGTFDIIVEVDGYLQKGFANVVITVGTNTLTIGEMSRGDINNDNNVGLADVSILNAAFGTEVGNDNYNLLADLNCDGIITLIDFSILNGGYGLIGDEVPLN